VWSPDLTDPVDSGGLAGTTSAGRYSCNHAGRIGANMISTLTYGLVALERALTLVEGCGFLQRTSRWTNIVRAAGETPARDHWAGAGFQVRRKAIAEVVDAFAAA